MCGYISPHTLRVKCRASLSMKALVKGVVNEFVQCLESKFCCIDQLKVWLGTLWPTLQLCFLNSAWNWFSCTWRVLSWHVSISCWSPCDWFGPTKCCTWCWNSVGSWNVEMEQYWLVTPQAETSCETTVKEGFLTAFLFLSSCQLTSLN